MNGAKFVKAIYFLLLAAVFAMVAACGTNTGDGDSPVRESKATAPQLVEPQDHGGGFGWQNDRCFLCHQVVELKEIHDYSPALASSFAKVPEEDVGACLYCHGSNGLENVTAETYNCLLCHENSSIVDTSGMFAGTHQHDFNGNDKMDSSDCITCHAFSDMNGEIDVTIDFSKSGSAYASKTDFCLNCHDGNGAFGVMPPALSFEADAGNIYSTYKGTGDTTSTQMLTADIHGIKNGNGQSFGVFRGDYAGSMTVPCLSCHMAHSSDNPYLITESGSTAVLSDDTATGASVSVTENNFTQLCAVCHMNENGAPTDNGLLEVVHTSTYSSNCTTCHYHGSGYGSDNSDLF